MIQQDIDCIESAMLWSMLPCPLLADIQVMSVSLVYFQFIIQTRLQFYKDSGFYTTNILADRSILHRHSNVHTSCVSVGCWMLLYIYVIQLYHTSGRKMHIYIALNILQLRQMDGVECIRLISNQYSSLHIIISINTKPYIMNKSSVLLKRSTH